MIQLKEHWYRGEADSSTTKLYSDNSLKSVFSTKTITVEFGCNKANRPKMLVDPSANIVFAYVYSYEQMKVIKSHIMKQNADFQEGISQA